MTRSPKSERLKKFQFIHINHFVVSHCLPFPFWGKGPANCYLAFTRGRGSVNWFEVIIELGNALVPSIMWKVIISESQTF